MMFKAFAISILVLLPSLGFAWTDLALDKSQDFEQSVEEYQSSRRNP